MKRFGLVSFALPFALLLGAGCHGVVQHIPTFGIKAQSPKAPAEMSFVSDDGKSSLAAFHIAYAKRGATRQELNPNFIITSFEYQTLKTSKDRLGDSDTLLLIFDVRGDDIMAERECAVVAQGGILHPAIVYPAMGFKRLNLATLADQVEIMLIPRVAGFEATVMSPPDEDKNKGPWVSVFTLPPPYSHLTLQGVKGFSHIKFDLN